MDQPVTEDDEHKEKVQDGDGKERRENGGGVKVTVRQHREAKTE